MKSTYQILISLAVCCASTTLPAVSADTNWQTQDGYFSGRGTYAGHPPDVIGPSVIEQNTATSNWQNREITNSAVIESKATNQLIRTTPGNSGLVRWQTLPTDLRVFRFGLF